MDDNVTPELLEALAKAQQEIGDAKKGAVNTFDKYKYATLENYLSAVKKPCLDNGLLLQSRVIGEPTYSTRTVKSGAEETVCRLLVETRVIHAKSGGSMSVSCWGEGQDRSDKSIYKAITGARKYSIAMLFGIYTTDDPEKDPAPAEYQPLRKPAPAVDSILGAIQRERSIEKMGPFTKRVDDLESGGQLTKDDAKRCRKAIAERTAELASANGHLVEA